MLLILSFKKEFTLSKATYFSLFKLKEFADDNFKFGKNSRKLSKQVKNQAISPLPTVFSKGWYCRQVKNQGLLGKELIINPFRNKPWFLSVCNTSLSKTLWVKEELLVMSNFSFSHCVFYLF